MKTKVVITCINEEEAMHLCTAFNQAREHYAATGQRVGGAIAGIILDRAARSQLAVTFSEDDSVKRMERALRAGSAMLDGILKTIESIREDDDR